MLLELNGVSAGYNGIVAIDGISINVLRGEIVAVLGANGAGKSTTLRAISGVVAPYCGTIQFEGKRIDGMSPEVIVEMGISHVPEGRKIFPGLTVLDNLKLGAVPRKHSRKELELHLEEVYELFPRLRDLSRRLGWMLSGGEAQMLAIGRGLMAKPKLLILDEPSLGLAPIIIQQVFENIQSIASRGVTILIVEQNANLTLQIASRAYVLETGRVVVSGDAKGLMTNEQVKRAYLGGH